MTGSSLRWALIALAVPIIIGIVLVTVPLAPPAAAPTAGPVPTAEPGCETGANDTVETLLACVTVAGVRTHLEAFQQIADANGGTRASGTPGYDASADYVEDQARAAGLTTTRQRFEFPFFQQRTPTELVQVGPTPTTYVEERDHGTGTLSGSADVTAPVQAVDVVDVTGRPENTSTSGCEATDFAGFTRGNIALLQRGTCPFGQKVTNAAAAGAVGAILINEGQEGRTDLFGADLGTPQTIPAVTTATALGRSLDTATVRIKVDALAEVRSTENVFAETPGDPAAGRVVMVGAHLDSVAEGPGINDNGSGSAAILEVAKLIARAEPATRLRFAWWGAEELGLVGSTTYVRSLSEPDRGRIAAYLNFDMVGSPNYVRFVYDGDNSDAEGAGPGPEGSAAVEDVLERFHTDRGLAYAGTDFDGRSDYGPFIEAGIPAGGLFSGAEEVKSAEQAATFGGTAGQALDGCYHQACDTLANLDDTVLDQFADAIAYATLTLATAPPP